MPYCPGCGNEVEQPVIIAASTGAEAVNAEVEIARINAERDIQVAKITARQDRDWNETRVEVAELETAAEVASASAEAEVIGAILATDPEPAEDTEPEPEPLIVTEPPADDGLDLAPPESTHRSSEPKSGGGWSFN
jgi:hypothetical protein